MREHEKNSDINVLLAALVSSALDCFDGVVGVYLHGSLAFGCFRAEVSDVDVLVVLSAAPSHTQKRLYVERLLELNEHAPKKGIELSVVLREHTTFFTHPAPYELHFSSAHTDAYRADLDGHIEKLHGTDRDLAAHFTVTKAVGRVLYGQPIEDVFGNVPTRAYIDSILYDIENAANDIVFDPIYVTLNLCRCAAWCEDGAVLSKSDGGRWAERHVPKEYHPIIYYAIDTYTGGGKQKEKPTEKELCEFAAYMVGERCRKLYESKSFTKHMN